MTMPPPLVTLFVSTMMGQSAKKQAKESAEEALAAQERQADIQRQQMEAQRSKSETVGGQASSQTAGFAGTKKKTLGKGGLYV